MTKEEQLDIIEYIEEQSSLEEDAVTKELDIFRYSQQLYILIKRHVDETETYFEVYYNKIQQPDSYGYYNTFKKFDSFGLYTGRGCGFYLPYDKNGVEHINNIDNLIEALEVAITEGSECCAWQDRFSEPFDFCKHITIDILREDTQLYRVTGERSYSRDIRFKLNKK